MFLTGRYQCLLPMTLTPIAVVCGSGDTYEEAQKQAAYNALNYLRLMTKRIVAPSISSEAPANANDSSNEEKTALES